MNEETLKLIIEAQNKAKAVLEDANKQIEGLNVGSLSFSKLGGKAMSVAFEGIKIAAAAAATGIAALGAGIAYSVKQYADSEQVQAQLGAVLKSTGGVAGITADQVNALSTQLERTTGVSDEAATASQALLLTYTSIGKDIFPDAEKAALDMATALNNGAIPSTQDLAANTQLLGKALQDPDAGLGALHRVGVNVDELSKKFNDSMSIQEKQKLILQELQTEYGGSAEAAGKTLYGSLNILKEAFGDVTEQVGAEFAPIIQKAAEYLSDFAHFIQDNFGPIRDKVVDFFKAVIDGSPFIKTLRDKFEELKDMIVEGIEHWDDTKQRFNQLMLDFDAKTGVITGLKDEFKEIWRLLSEEFIPTIIENKQLFIDLAKVIGAIVVVALFAILEGVKLLIKAFDWLLPKITQARDFFVNLYEDAKDLPNFFTDIGGAAQSLANLFKQELSMKIQEVIGWFQALPTHIEAAIISMRDTAVAKVQEFIAAFAQAGRDVVDGFINGVREKFASVGQAAIDLGESAKNAIKNALGIHSPSTVFNEYGQNTADGFIEGLEERQGAFADSFDTLLGKAKDAWTTFTSAAKEAKKTYKQTINEIKDKTTELKSSFASDFASAVLDIRSNIADLKSDLADTSTSYDQQIAGKIVDAQEELATSQSDLATEMAKSQEDQDADTIASLQSTIAEKEAFLSKHADVIKSLDSAVSEEKRQRGLDDIEVLMEQKNQETSVIQQQIDSENAILDAHKADIQKYHDDIAEQQRVSSLDSLTALQEQFANEKAALVQQEADALQIKKDSMKEARKALRKSLENIAEDTKDLIGQLTKEFATIPDSLTAAMDKITNRLTNAGAAFAGANASNGGGNTTNNKNISLVLNSSGGSDDILKRLERLIKIL